MSRLSLINAAQQLLHPEPVGAGQVSGETANTIISFEKDIESLFVTQAEVRVSPPRITVAWLGVWKLTGI